MRSYEEELMAERYSRVSRRIWGDKNFRELSPIPPCGQGLWFRLLVAPEQNSIPGLFSAWEAGLAQALGWSLEAFREAFREVSSKGMVKADWKTGLVWCPNAIRHNPPASANVVTSWRAHFDELPECELKSEAFRGIKAFVEGMPKAFRDAFDKAFGKACPIQDQDQEHEQDHDPDVAGAGAPAAQGPLCTTEPETAIGHKPQRSKPSGSDHQSVVDHYFVEFESKHRRKPIFKAADGKAVKTLLKDLGGDAARAKAIITNAINSWRGDVTIRDIASNPSKFLTPSPPRQGQRHGPPQPNSTEELPDFLR